MGTVLKDSWERRRKNKPSQPGVLNHPSLETVTWRCEWLYALKSMNSLPMYNLTTNANSIPIEKHGSMQKDDLSKGTDMEINLNMM